MATIVIDSDMVYYACIKYIEKHQKIIKESNNALNDLVEEEHMKTIVILKNMSKYSAVTVNSYEFNLIQEYL